MLFLFRDKQRRKKQGLDDVPKNKKVTVLDDAEELGQDASLKQDSEKAAPHKPVHHDISNGLLQQVRLK